MKFQPVLPIELTDKIRWINRPVFRILESAEIPEGPSDKDRETGLGDTNLISLLGPATKRAGGNLLGCRCFYGISDRNG